MELEPDGARALVRHVGDRQQRLLRELEKLALGAEDPDPAHPAEPLDADAVERLTASSAERRAWTVADAVVAGETRAAVDRLPPAAPAGRAPAGAALLDLAARPDRARGRRRAGRRRAAGAGQAAAADALPRRRPAHRRRPADRL